MPLPQLLRVSSELLHHKMTSVRRKALDLLNTKLQTLLSGKLDPEEEEALLHMVSVLVSLVQEGHVEDDNDSVACRQMALFSLKLLCKVLGSRHTQEFAKVRNWSLCNHEYIAQFSNKILYLCSHEYKCAC